MTFNFERFGMQETLNKQEKLGKISLKNLIEDYAYQDESILIKTILRDEKVNIALLLVDSGQGLIEHAASTEAMVYIVEGEIKFTISNQNYSLIKGSFLKLEAGVPHSFIAVEKTRMLLIIMT